MKKAALFAFNGEATCFVHVLLNALDMLDKGYDVKIIVEGAATVLIPEIAAPAHPLSGLYKKAKEKNLFEGACKACSAKLKATEGIEKEGIPLIGEMSGHPAMAYYMDNGYQIITF